MEKKNLFGLCPYVTSQKVLTGKWSMYTVDDNLMTVFVFESGIATIYSFTEEPKVINL